jgi:hypothetical protein
MQAQSLLNYSGYVTNKILENFSAENVQNTLSVDSKKQKEKAFSNMVEKMVEHTYNDAKVNENNALNYVNEPQLGDLDPDIESLTFQTAELGLMVDTFVALRNSLVDTVNKLQNMPM